MNMRTEEIISSEVDPELANQLTQKALGTDDRPEHPLPPKPPDETLVVLPGGWVRPDGVIITEAEVREMTGEVEEVISRPAVQRNVARLTTELLVRTVVHIGGQEPDEEIIHSLLVGDIDALIMGVRRATYGDTLDLSVVCGMCRNDFEVEYSLSQDVPVRELSSQERVFDVELRHGKVAQVSLPTGADQLAVWDAETTSTVERNHIMLGRCLRTVDGVPRTGLAAVRSLGSADIRTLLDFISKTSPGPRYEEVTQECPKCGGTSPLIIGLADLFRL